MTGSRNLGYIDLTGDEQDETAESSMDRLTTLPSELLHMIFSFLFARHHPDKAFFVAEISKKKCSHPLDFVAATSKLLRAEVNEWAKHLLLQYKGVTLEKQPKGKEKDKTYNALRGRNGLLSWSDIHCIFCGKSTSRFAILMNGFHCCRACDTKEWPDKITKTNALAEYDLREHELLPERHMNTPQVKKLEERFPHGVPSIHRGTYNSCGVRTTMFLRKDVEWLARLYHTDLTTHLAKRDAAKKERARKREEAKNAGASATKIGHGETVGTSAVDPYYVDED